jgi:hypothetical protein
LLEAGRSLDLLSDSGGRATVEDVELVAMEMKDSEIGIEARCTWTVTTVTSRWGHSRHRVHRVVADLRIEPVDGVWKITGMDLAGRPRL